MSGQPVSALYSPEVSAVNYLLREIQLAGLDAEYPVRCEGMRFTVVLLDRNNRTRLGEWGGTVPELLRVVEELAR